MHNMLYMYMSMYMDMYMCRVAVNIILVNTDAAQRACSEFSKSPAK